MPGFEYSLRTHCVCGSILSEFMPTIRRDVEWGEVKFIQCKRCRSWCQSPQITPASISDWYDSDEYRGGANVSGSAYVDYLKDESCRLREGHKRYQRDLVNYLPEKNAKVLEVGCATGSLLAAIREYGHDVTGIDISPRFAKEAKELYDLDVQVGDMASADFPQQHFDMIILLGTVSNLQDIPTTLIRIRKMLKIGGALIFNFPDANSLTARLYGERYWMFAPSVGTFMTTDCCKKLLSTAGFDEINIKIDYQMPSFSKVLNHSKLSQLIPVSKIFSHRFNSFPFLLPIPGVKLARARIT